MHPKLVQLVCLVLCVALLAVGGHLQGVLDQRSQQLDLIPPGDVVAQKHPEVALLSVAPGGLRAIALNFLWMRSQDLKEKGRIHESAQLASLICRLQPRFPGVWWHQAWDMAYNISVQTHTPRERWQWVTNGMKLLRDEGIPLNPEALILYRELGWIFFNKMGMTLDDMHMHYKARWAAQMQRLLGAPPYAPTPQVIEAFRPIAMAPLDRDVRRQGAEVIQRDKLAELMQDSQVAAYAAELSGYGIEADWRLIDAYNRYTNDDAVAITRAAPVRLQSDRDRELSALINSQQHRQALDRMLAFVRTQLLWNEYRLDSDWMLQLMEKYGPLDWRLVWPHGLYWVTLGIHRVEDRPLADIDSMNTDRIVFNCLKDLTWFGRMTYVENPRDRDTPNIWLWSDSRFIEPCHQEHILLGTALAKEKNQAVHQTVMASGHINYLEQAIQMLVTERRISEAEKYLNFIKDEMKMREKGGPWQIESVEEFAINQINAEGAPIAGLAISQISASLRVAYLELAAGRRDAYRKSFDYAAYVYTFFQKNSHERIRLRPFNEIAAQILAEMLIDPRQAGYSVPIMARSRMYAGASVELQLIVYDTVERYLRDALAEEELNFDQAFPPPPGLQQYRQQMEQRRWMPAGE